MELRLLSFGEACDLGPDPAAEIRPALKQLAKHSGDILPRAVLVHDNGEDFIQFYSTKAPGSGKLKGKAPCHVQWCRHSEGGSEPEHYCSDDVQFDQVMDLFQLYAQKKQDWDKGVSWEPYKDKGRQTKRAVAFVCGSLFILLGIWVYKKYGASTDRFISLPVFGLSAFFLWASIFPGTGHGRSWDLSSDGGGSCSRGCRSGCGGSAGGGGDGGGCGGCGGGGGE